MKAEVQYFATADKTVDGQIVGIMMIKSEPANKTAQPEPRRNLTKF